jgi:hypothetical protein
MAYPSATLQASSRADWIDTLEFRDDANALIDLTDATIILDVRRPNVIDDTPVLSATTDNGKIEITGLGVAEFHFPRSEMIGVHPQSYDLGVTIARDGVTDQAIVASVLIYDGIVRK